LEELTTDPYPEPSGENAGKKLKIKHYVRNDKADNFSFIDKYRM
jgi:hypothetical protein